MMTLPFAAILFSPFAYFPTHSFVCQRASGSAAQSSGRLQGFSAEFRWHIFARCSERRVSFYIDWLADNSCSSRILFQLDLWSNRSRTEATAAVGAHVLEQCLDASPAEGALVAADHGLRRIRRQCPGAGLADGA